MLWNEMRHFRFSVNLRRCPDWSPHRDCFYWILNQCNDAYSDEKVPVPVYSRILYSARPCYSANTSEKHLAEKFEACTTLYSWPITILKAHVDSQFSADESVSRRARPFVSMDDQNLQFRKCNGVDQNRKLRSCPMQWVFWLLDGLWMRGRRMRLCNGCSACTFMRTKAFTSRILLPLSLFFA